MDSWVSLVDQLGVPVAVLMALILALWRTARWLAPRADKALDGHLKFLDVNTEINKGLLDTQKSLERTIQVHHETTTERLKDIHEIVRSWHGKGTNPDGPK